MASITTDARGSRRILFTDRERKRRSIRLGKVPMKSAEAIKVKVEDLVHAAFSGHTPKDETSKWLATIDKKLSDRLAKCFLGGTMYTRGPWTHTKNRDQQHEIWAGDKCFIGSPSCEDVSYEEAGDNATLMAAAPELAAALKGMLDWARRVKQANPGMALAKTGVLE